ncbi:hypothetical protein GGF31_001747 [Allomyces arbusculus]|nr:hypothetical protein GGF31_001747 [Allomyces arbusculus]
MGMTASSITTTLDRRPMICAPNHDAASAWNHRAPVLSQALVPIRPFSTTRIVSASGKDIAKLFLGAVVVRGLDAAEKYDQWREKRRQKREVEKQLGGRISDKMFDRMVEDASKVDPNSPQAKRIKQLALEANGGVEPKSGMTVIRLPQVEIDALRFAPRFLEPTSKMSFDVKGFPVIPPEFFESLELDTEGLNPMTVRLKKQMTLRQPFQLFMVNTPEIAALMVRRCAAAQRIALDIETHALVPTLPPTFCARPDFMNLPFDNVTLPTSRRQISIGPFASSIQVAVRNEVPLSHENLPRVVSSVFYVPLGDTIEQPWKAHALHAAFAAGSKAKAQFLVHGGQADLSVLTNKLRIPVDHSRISDLQMLFNRWRTLTALFHQHQQLLGLTPPGMAFQRDVLLSHAAIKNAQSTSSKKGGAGDATLRNGRSVSLNDMLRACGLSENLLKDDAMRRSDITLRVLYAALDVDQMDAAYVHINRCIDQIKAALNDHINKL